ncbi:MAG: hypothetical protein ONB14_11590 [candidate division KSB1 bacterium]|nr:hypothetical protein [candidate division KSB1 bacterium]
MFTGLLGRAKLIERYIQLQKVANAMLEASQNNGEDDKKFLPRNVSKMSILVAIVLLAVVRWPVITLPISVDLASYSVGAGEILRGVPLYGAGVWDMKPPGIFLLLAAWQGIFGVGEVQLWALGFVLAAVTLASIMIVAQKLGNGDLAGTIAGGLWVVAGSLPTFNADRMLPDSLMIAGLAVMAACVVLGNSGRAGIAACVAILTKPTAAMLVAPLIAWHVAKWGRGSWQMIAGLIAPALLVVVWLIKTSDLAEAWYACVSYAGWFAGDPLQNVVAGMAPDKLAGPMPWLFAALLVLAIPAFCRYPWALGFLVAAWVMAALPGKWWPHYYQPILTLLIILAGLGTARLRSGIVLSTLVGGIVLAESWPTIVGRGENLIVLRNLAREATCRELGHALSGTTFWQWGDDQCLYFYARVRPPTGMTWADHLTYTRSDLRDMHLDRIIKSAPAIVVINRRFWLSPPERISSWLDDLYKPILELGWYEVWKRT